MALKSTLQRGIFLLVAAVATFRVAYSADPDILSDFLLPPNATAVDGNYFTYTGFRQLVDAPLPSTFTVTEVTSKEFPALEGQSVSYSVLIFPNRTLNPPHVHPRSAELLFLLSGDLQVGFVDTTGKLYTQQLQSGDIFVFPKGLVQYQYNSNAQYPAVALSAYGSANAGIVHIPSTLFASGIDDNILAKSLKTGVATVQKIKAGLAPKS